MALPNPIIAASGTFGFGPEYAPYVNLARLGAVAAKGVSWDPWPGNPPPRVWETAAGLLNSIGLQNPGVEVFCREDLPFLRRAQTRVIANVIGRTIDEYARVVERLEREAGIDAIEVNISCPNVKEGGISFGQDPDHAAAVTRAVRAVTRRPVIVKLSPNVSDPVAIAQAVAAAGADALSAINTVIGMAIDLKRRRPALGAVTGGLSGPAIKPIALRVVWEVAQSVHIPIIGIGGIESAEDVVEFLMAGATAVMMGTVTFRDPGRMEAVIEALPATLRALGFECVRDAIGAAQGFCEEARP
ncbi:MAG: dihydroorotate dehydrogenase [Firmicutes bacterium]|nr:dihydroorotate dehydrogenase [Alicyclobacillaceae bacterium]MCL6496486.1 dihydroorotate dehydrogenase [Bacillota bacterium]